MNRSTVAAVALCACLLSCHGGGAGADSLNITMFVPNPCPKMTVGTPARVSMAITGETRDVSYTATVSGPGRTASDVRLPAPEVEQVAGHGERVTVVFTPTSGQDVVAVTARDPTKPDAFATLQIVGPGTGCAV